MGFLFKGSTGAGCLLFCVFFVETIGLEVALSHARHHSHAHKHHHGEVSHIAHPADSPHHHLSSRGGFHHHTQNHHVDHHKPKVHHRAATHHKTGLRGLKHSTPRVQKVHKNHHVHALSSHREEDDAAISWLPPKVNGVPVKGAHHFVASKAKVSKKKGDGARCYESDDVEMGELVDCEGDTTCFVRYREDVDGVKTYFRRYCAQVDACIDHEGSAFSGDEFKSYAESGGNVFYKCCSGEGCNGPIPATIPSLPGDFYITDADGKYLGMNSEGEIVKGAEGFKFNEKFSVTEVDGGYSMKVLGLPADKTVDVWQISRTGLSSYAISGTSAAGPVDLNGETGFSLMPATSWDIVKKGKTCPTLKDAGYSTLAACTMACDGDSDCTGAVAWPSSAFNFDEANGAAFCQSPMVCKCMLVTAECAPDSEVVDAAWNVYKHKCAGVTCTALDQCHTVGVCSRETGECDQPTMSDLTGCDDNDENTVEDVCTAGVCAGVNKCADVVCTPQNQCFDEGVCDKFTGECSEPMKSIGTACDDGNAGTVNDQCVSGECRGQDRCEGVVCEQLDDCHTVGQCDSLTGTCTNPLAAVDTSCDDGADDTVEDKCTVDGACQGVNKCLDVVCSAKDQCHGVGSCDHQTGLCSNPPKPAESECDDGNDITVSDQCDGKGTCAGTDLCASVACADWGTCFSQGLCDHKTGTCNYDQKGAEDPCDDGNSLTIEDKCSSDGVCSGKGRCEDVTCTALEPQCHLVGQCNPEDGSCSSPKKSDGTTCNDGNDLTVNDQCTGGFCAGEDLCDGVTCEEPDTCQEAGTCDFRTGECIYPTSADDTECDDGNEVTVEDKCSSGGCAGVDKCADVSCPALSACHEDGRCDKHTGVCSVDFKPNGATCDDESAYTKNDKCDGKGACAGEKLCAGVVCEAKDQCHDVGLCNDLTGECDDPAKAAGASCDDEDADSIRDVCMITADGVGRECKGEYLCAEVTCLALDGCHEAGECDPQTGSCSNPQAADDTECDDMNQFTATDKCKLGVCLGEQLISCETKKIEIPEVAEMTLSSTQQSFQETADFACPEGEVMSSARWTPFNSHEDLTLRFGCSATASGTEQCVYTAGTVPAEDFAVSCDSGFALAGIEATYTETQDQVEDRVYKFLCCKISNSVSVVDADTLVACDSDTKDGGNCNKSGGKVSFTLGAGTAITKVESKFDSLEVDRVWKFYSSGFEEEICSECHDVSCLPKAF